MKALSLLTVVMIAITIGGTLYIRRKSPNNDSLYLYNDIPLDSAILKAINSEGKIIKRRGK